MSLKNLEATTSPHHLLITGASGFLGSKICKRLVNQGYTITAMIRTTSNRDRLQGIPVGFLEANQPRAMEAFDWNSVDALIHTATNYGRDNASPSKLISDNVLFPIDVLARLPHRAPFINTDSFFSKPSLKNDSLLGYTICKRQLLEWLRSESRRTVINMRLEHVFGPHDSNTKFVPTILEKLVRGVPRIPLTHGNQERDFIYVDDVVEAYRHALVHLNDLGPGLIEVEVGRGHSTTVRALVELMKQLSGSSSRLVFGELQPNQGEVQTSQANIDTLKSWGWSPTWSLERGVAACIQDLKERAKLA